MVVVAIPLRLWWIREAHPQQHVLCVGLYGTGARCIRLELVRQATQDGRTSLLGLFMAEMRAGVIFPDGLARTVIFPDGLARTVILPDGLGRTRHFRNTLNYISAQYCSLHDIGQRSGRL